ncbi:hypothetical protein BDA99DRAFT_576995, partial [Phascolomyces articulosus]
MLFDPMVWEYGSRKNDGIRTTNLDGDLCRYLHQQFQRRRYVMCMRLDTDYIFKEIQDQMTYNVALTRGLPFLVNWVCLFIKKTTAVYPIYASHTNPFLR